MRGTDAKIAASLFLLLGLFSPVVLSGLVDFSPGLIEHVHKRFGVEGPRRLAQMQLAVNRIKATAGKDFGKNVLRSTDGQFEMPILRQVNDYYNRVPYFTDQEHWGVNDYWATPVEFVASWGGDCEDYAIAKYMTLKDLGIPAERLRITYVRATRMGETHMVLAYYPTPTAEPWILDNLVDEIQPGSARSDLVPVYSFNDEDLWLASGSTRKGGASTVRLWKEMIEKMEKERRM
ncbi:transglutaminase-like cysteine peptidase [Undibacterium sp. TS12]|uniref:transglutaminase-like cysteine peptidase n=1 Tax=Undibacterium sp. TS12 TaxID=2908202 RepID=UPI001F4C92B2|nr:transglutaminase-like cysteine peptidase [Undibacterium sp. TS12]MCH8618009.1 transglutaminase-like cysteine peptidase [Undibacterium sp. TS12]